MTRHIWTKEELKELVLQKSVDGYMPKSAELSNTELTAIRTHWGGLTPLMEELGLKNKPRIKSEQPKKNTYVQKPSSICWDCQRSGAPPDIQCSWDANLKMPPGAIFSVRENANEQYRYTQLITITSCPLFIPIDPKRLKKVGDNE